MAQDVGQAHHSGKATMEAAAEPSKPEVTVPKGGKVATAMAAGDDAEENPHYPQPSQRSFWHRLFYSEKDPDAKPFSFLFHKTFWVALMIGQILSWCITGTNTFTTYITAQNANIPGFQTFLNYALLTVTYGFFSVYKLGPRGYAKVLLTQGWKFAILSLFDVVGNYLVVQAYAYSNLLSCQLLDGWATVVCVILSFLFLKVRYHWTQVLGVVLCIGGLALLTVSDLLTGKNYQARDRLKGDLFMLAGASCYGVSNVLEEFLVTKQPIYVVVGQMGSWGVLINGIICIIFERSNIRDVEWNGKLGGYLAGFTILMWILYSLVPVLLRISSASFYNISLLTSDFWGLIIGIGLFGYYVYWLYPVAFVLIVVGLGVYFTMLNVKGESQKPWVDYSNPQTHVDGVGTYDGPENRYARGNSLA